MNNLSYRHIVLCFLFASGGTVGGWALTGKLAGEEAALSFIYVGATIVLMISVVQFVLYSLGRKRLLYRLLCNIAFACGIVWFMLCLLLPVFWMPTVSGVEKCVLFSLLISLSGSNIFRAGKQFREKWGAEAEQALVKNYNIKKRTIDWPKVVATLRFSPKLYIPGVPEGVSSFVSFIMIVSMVVGLFLRNYFPGFSLFAWSIPTCLVISIFMQMIGFGIAQIIRLLLLERKYGVCISPKD